MNISNNINNNSVAYLSAPINNRAAYQAPNSFASTSSTISLPQILTLLNQLVSLLSNSSLNTNNPASYNANTADGFNPQNRHMGQPMQPNHFGYNASAQNNPMSPAAYQPASLPWTNVNVNQYSPMQQGFQNPNAHGAHYAASAAKQPAMNHNAPTMPNAAQRDMGQATIFNGHGINQNAIAADNNGVINQRVAAPGFADPRGMNHPAMPAMPNQPGMNHPAMPAMPNQGGMNPAVAANKPADAEPKKADKQAGHNHGHKKAAKKPEAMPEIANKPAMRQDINQPAMRNMNPQGMNGMQGMPSMDMNGMNQAGMPGMNMNVMNQAGMPGMNMNGMNQAGMPGMNMNGMDHHGMENMLDEDGKMKPGHDFYAHVSHMYPETLAANQARYGGYSWINDNTLVAKSPITGMQPVIDQAIADVMKKPANKRLSIGALESKVANRLTQLNDWKTLTKDTQEKLVNLTGIDFGKMTKAEREKSINHLLHSPLPFGAVTEILTPDMRVDLGFTHTLDQNKTMFNDLGNGLFNITLISNNNNGSHTGHNLGSFNVQLDADATDKDAKKAVKEMLVNTNNNNRLYLDSVARDQLYQYKAT